MSDFSYIDLTTTEPEFNLAVEQYVFDILPKDRMYFMLWQNRNSIIIGKYQNTLAEINLPYVNEHGIHVVRRLSGGGAVYHDLGNLNFTFVADAGNIEKLNMRVFCEPIVDALHTLGVKAEINGRNDITIDGKKFSGNAQYLRQGRIMHHGTIMFDSDLSVVENALKVDPSKIEAKGIKSVRSRVTCVRPYLEKDVSLETFRKLLLESILKNNPGQEYVFSGREIAEINEIKAQRYATWDWNFGKSPECTMKKSARIDGCGKIEAYITLEHSRIISVVFKGDFFSTEDPEKLAEKLTGIVPEEQEYLRVLKDVDISAYFSNLSMEKFIELMN